MQRSERQVSGFCNSQRRFDGFQISHFSDQHNIRIFTEGCAQSVTKALGVSMQFPLVDHAVLVHVNEFDRVLDGKDVIVPLGIDFVDHRCKSC